MASHLKLFKALWARAVMIMEANLIRGGIVVIEWPTSCAYWRFRQAKQFLQKHGLKTVKIHGCAFGMTVSDGGGLVYKPWTLATNSLTFHANFEPYRCSRDHQHVTLEGRETTRSSSYPIKMAKLVHTSFKAALEREGDRFHTSQ